MGRQSPQTPSCDEMHPLRCSCWPGNASVASRVEEAKARLRHAIELDKDIRELALDDEDLRRLLRLSQTTNNY